MFKKNRRIIKKMKICYGRQSVYLCSERDYPNICPKPLRKHRKTQEESGIKFDSL
jgi:hypothetical protein